MEILKNLKSLIDNENIVDFNKKIYELINCRNEEVLKNLIFLLDDECEYDEYMYSVIHAMEKLPLGEFVKNYVDRIEILFEQSPNWAGYLLVRVSNNNMAFLIFKDLISSNSIKRDCFLKVREVAITIKSDMPNF